MATLIEDAGIWKSLRQIVTRFTADPGLQQDLMQECFIRLWRMEREQPGRTQSWYLQNCRFHLQHWLAAGRSVDSPKRAFGHKRITIDGIDDGSPLDWYHTNGDVLEAVCARDIVSTLTRHLKPCESAVLDGLADGLVLRDIAVKLKLSYPTALKHRRKIAAMTIKLGIYSPLPLKKEGGPPVLLLEGVGSAHNGKTFSRTLQPDPLPNALPGTQRSRFHR